MFASNRNGKLTIFRSEIKCHSGIRRSFQGNAGNTQTVDPDRRRFLELLFSRLQEIDSTSIVVHQERVERNIGKRPKRRRPKKKTAESDDDSDSGQISASVIHETVDDLAMAGHVDMFLHQIVEDPQLAAHEHTFEQIINDWDLPDDKDREEEKEEEVELDGPASKPDGTLRNVKTGENEVDIGVHEQPITSKPDGDLRDVKTGENEVETGVHEQPITA